MAEKVSDIIATAIQKKFTLKVQKPSKDLLVLCGTKRVFTIHLEGVVALGQICNTLLKTYFEKEEIPEEEKDKNESGFTPDQIWRSYLHMRGKFSNINIYQAGSPHNMETCEQIGAIASKMNIEPKEYIKRAVDHLASLNKGEERFPGITELTKEYIVTGVINSLTTKMNENYIEQKLKRKALNTNPLEDAKYKKIYDKRKKPSQITDEEWEYARDLVIKANNGTLKGTWLEKHLEE